MSCTDKTDVLFDYTFCDLFKSQEPTILRVVQKSTSSNGSASGSGAQGEASLSVEEHKLLLEYKELIRKQDTQLVTMGKQLASLQLDNHTLVGQITESRALVQQLQDQLALLRSQNSFNSNSSQHSYS